MALLNPVQTMQPDDHTPPALSVTGGNLNHLDRLESESIHIIREVVAEFRNPVLLYSIGKDSAVLLHLAMKAFAPGKLPFPLLHVDTQWKFREMIEYRDAIAKRLDLDMRVHTNPDGAGKIGPFSHGSQVHTDIMKTAALKQSLDKYGFDAAFGGARRDEEKSRAKERVLSFRSKAHRWDPKNQRPELWNLYNPRVLPGRVSGRFRCRTGLSWISGSISTGKIFRWYRCILRRSVRWLSGTAC